MEGAPSHNINGIILWFRHFVPLSHNSSYLGVE